jgi:hypothetical protein
MFLFLYSAAVDDNLFVFCYIASVSNISQSLPVSPVTGWRNSFFFFSFFPTCGTTRRDVASTNVCCALCLLAQEKPELLERERLAGQDKKQYNLRPSVLNKKILFIVILLEKRGRRIGGRRAGILKKLKIYIKEWSHPGGGCGWGLVIDSLQRSLFSSVVIIIIPYFIF